MKRILFVISLIVLITMSTGSESIRLARLTIVNKSGLDIEISLTGEEEENFYYLRVPEGDRTFPTKRVFTIIPDTYASQLYYVELWDPVYGYGCDSKSQTLDIIGNMRVVILECERIPPDPGVPSIVKYGASKRSRVR